MKLLVFAHRAEAYAFTQQLEAHPLLQKPELYQANNSHLILITGEGRMESMLALSHTLTLYPNINQVINLGVAASLSSKLKVGEIHPIKISYAHNGAKPIFQSFPIAPQGLDCLTTDDRILSREQKEKLSPFAQVLDRELWGLGMAVRHHQKELVSIKIISDSTEEENFCERVKERAHELSNELFKYFAKNLSSDSTHETTNVEYPQLYLTKSMQHKLQTILHALSIKYPNQNFIPQNKLDKQETLKFIQALEIKLNPLRHNLEQAFQHSYQALSDTGAKLGHDPKWEAKYLDLSIRITSEEQLGKLKQALTQSTYQDFLNIMQGTTLHADQ